LQAGPITTHGGEENVRQIILTTVMLVTVLAVHPIASAQKAKPKVAGSAQEADRDALRSANYMVDGLIKQVAPSVVQILVTSYGALEETPGRTGGSVGQRRAIGSGFVIDHEGYILTNAHVVNGAQRIQVVIPPRDADGSLTSALSSKANTFPAHIVGQSREIDVAVLKVDGAKAAALPLATYRKVRQGETVFAFGSPQGLRNTVTHGLISSVARQIDPDSPLIFIQTDAPVNPGNSGGPLVNVEGEVVGMNTFIVSQSGGNEGLGFAIPCATLRTVFRQLKEFGHLRRQEIGIGIQAITPEMAAALKLSREDGVVISDLVPGGPAESAGLKIGDVLVSVDGQPADNMPTVSYYFLLGDFRDKAQLMVLRGTNYVTLDVPVKEEKRDVDQVISLADPAKNLVPPLGILGLEIDTKIAKMVPGLRSPYGIIVAARAAGSGGDVPLVPGDVIRQFNGDPITTLAKLRDALKALTPGAPIVLQIQRDTRLQFLSFTLD
jgi:serine protease Do